MALLLVGSVPVRCTLEDGVNQRRGKFRLVHSMFDKSNQPRVDPMSRVMRYRDFWSYEISIKGMRASKDESTAFQKGFV